MKDGYLYLFKDFNGLKRVAGILHIKEQFVSNAFIKEGSVLIALNEDLSFRKTILLKKIKPYLIKGQEFSIEEYTQKYGTIMKKIYQYKEKNHISLSWLEIFQITALLSEESEITEQTIERASTELHKFYRFLETNF